jgi:hypothetical protein
VAVLQTVISLARAGLAGSEPVRLEAIRYGSNMVVSIAPDGVGHPSTDELTSRYQPVELASAHEGALEMYVCARLMNDQGGELLRRAVGAGSAYALRLPAEVPAHEV